MGEVLHAAVWERFFKIRRVQDSDSYRITLYVEQMLLSISRTQVLMPSTILNPI